MNCCCSDAAAGAVVERYDAATTEPTPDPEPAKEVAPEPEPAPYVEPVKVVEEAKPEPAPSSLPIEFDIGGGATKVVNLTERPLGISFKNVQPISVKTVEAGSGADKAGVQAGWVFTKIGNTTVPKDCSYADVLTMLKSGMDVLPPAKLVMEFDSNGTTRAITFTRKPLGINFDKTMPIQVKRIPDGSHAQELGVQAGWVFKTIKGKDVTKMEYPQIRDLIASASAGLPS